MTGNVATFMEILDRIAPVRLAEPWDNVGLQLGSRRWPVKKIWTALDALPDVVTQACEHDANLLVTHHPLIFKPIQRIDCETPLGRIIQTALSRRLAIYSAHTNLDIAAGGVNDVLAQKMGVQIFRVLEPSTPAHDGAFLPGINQTVGLGRVGSLSTEVSLRTFAESIKAALDIGAVKVVGDLDKAVKTVAICSGSGSSLLNAALDSGAQVYVSGDLGYHTARDAQQAGMGLIDIGHFGSERLIVAALAAAIRDASRNHGLDVLVESATIEADPFHHL